MLLTKSSYVILGMLSKHPFSGYDLKQKLSKVSAFYWSESNAQIYPVLKKLEEQNLVSSYLDETSGARNKRIFSITKRGLAELVAWLEEDEIAEAYREEFLLKFSLGQHLSKAKLVKKLQQYQHNNIEKLAQVNEVIEHIKDAHTNRADQRFLLLTYDNIKTLLEAKIQWCQKVLKGL